MPRILPESCLWVACAIFECCPRVLWPHSTLVWAAIRSLWLHQSTVGPEPQYCGPGPTVLWPGPTVLWVCLRAERKRCRQCGAPRPRSRPGNCKGGVCALLASSCGVLWLSLVLVWDDSGSHPRCCSFRHCGVGSCQPCASALYWDRRNLQGPPPPEGASEKRGLLST